MHKNAHSSSLHSNQKPETTHKSINRKWTVVYSNAGMACGDDNEQTRYIKNINESHGQMLTNRNQTLENSL